MIVFAILLALFTSAAAPTFAELGAAGGSGSTAADASPEARRRTATKLATDLKSEDPDVRQKAVSELKNLGSDAAPAMNALSAALADESPIIRAKAREALESIGAPALPAFVAAMSNPQPETRLAGVDGISRLGARAVEAIPALVKGLRDEDRGVRERSARVLAQLGDAATAPLIEAAKQGPATAQILAINALGSSATAESALSTLASLLEADNAQVRLSAQRALIRKKGAAVTSLTQALSSASPAARALAADAMAEIGRPAASAVPVLTTILTDAVPEVRASAARALGKMGSRASSALEALRTAAKDEDRTVASAAADAVTAIAALRGGAPDAATPREVKTIPAGETTAAPAPAPVAKTASAPKKAAAKPAPKEAPSAAMARWVKELDSRSAATASRARKSLLKAGPGALPALLSGLETSTTTTKLTRLSVLSEMGMSVSTGAPVVAGLVMDTDPLVASVAADAVQKMDPAVAKQTFIGVFASTTAIATQKILLPLVQPQIAADTATWVAPVAALMDSPDESVRLKAEAALKTSGAAEATKAVEGKMKERKRAALKQAALDLRKPESRAEASKALLEGGPESVSYLSGALSDANADVRLTVIDLLSKLGSKAAGAVPSLIQRLDDASPSVALAAADALEKIGTPPALDALGPLKWKQRKAKLRQMMQGKNSK